MEPDTSEGSRDTRLVSVVLPTYNRAETLRRAVHSVLSQTHRQLELIVVDDASEDETEVVIAQTADPRVRYMRHATRRGAPAARNTGISAALGEYVAFQDSDDEWSENKLEKQLQIFQCGSPDLGAVYCSFTRILPSGEEPVPRRFKDDMRGNILPRALRCRWIGTPTLVVKRQALNAVGGFEESLPRLQDWELVIKLAKHYAFEYVGEPLVKQYVTRGSISSDETALCRAIEQIMELHADVFDRDPVARSAQWVFMGNRKCLAGQIASGAACFRKALSTNPKSLMAWCGLALTAVGAANYRRVVAVKRRLVS